MIKVLHTKQTSNQLEYSALLFAVRSIFRGYTGNRPIPVKIIGDSELIIKQMKGENQVTSLKLKDLYEQVLEEVKLRNIHVTFQWVPRAQNLAGIELEKK